jgi:hypothetical protein
MKIFKYPLNLVTVLQLSDCGRLLTVQEQGPEVVLWAETDPEAPQVKVKVTLAFTGAEPPEGSVYINTVQLRNGIVVHVYAEDYNV